MDMLWIGPTNITYGSICIFNLYDFKQCISTEAKSERLK